MTLFSSNRIFIIPFDRHFEPCEQDNTLKSEFAKAEVQSAILNWLIQGYILLEKEGLNPPKTVTKATEDFNNDCDKVKRFFEECLVGNPQAEVRTSKVYKAFREWCYSNGYHAESAQKLNEAIRKFAVIKKKRPAGTKEEKTTMLIGYELIDKNDFL